MTQDNSELKSETIEISLTDIILFLKKYWFKLAVAGLIFTMLGYGLSYLMQPQYTSVARILPEYSSSSGSRGLSDLASLAGISVGKTGMDALRPDLYPDILSSKTFALKLMITSFPLTDGKEVLLGDYFGDKENKVEPLSKEQIQNSDSIINLTANQNKILKLLTSKIKADIDKISGIITISSEMPDPVLATACTSFSLGYLKEFVSNYRNSKENEKVAFFRKQLSEAKSKYRNTELQLNAYRDRNINTYTNTARVEEQRLQGDFIQAQSLYGELARQFESAKLQALEDSPVLKVLDPPMVPIISSKPRRVVIALVFGILGGCIYLILLLVRLKRVTANS